MHIKIFCLFVDFICTGEIVEEKLNHLCGEISRLNFAHDIALFRIWLRTCVNHYGTNPILQIGDIPDIPEAGFYQHHEDLPIPSYIPLYISHYMRYYRANRLLQRVCMGCILLSSKMDDYNRIIRSDTYLYQIARAYLNNIHTLEAICTLSPPLSEAPFYTNMNRYPLDEVLNYYADECETLNINSLAVHPVYDPFKNYALAVDKPRKLYDDDDLYAIELYLAYARGNRDPLKNYVLDNKIITICDRFRDYFTDENLLTICKKYVEALNLVDLFNFDGVLLFDVRTTVLTQIAMNFGMPMAIYLRQCPRPINDELLRILREYLGGHASLEVGVIRDIHALIVRDYPNDEVRLDYIIAALLLSGRGGVWNPPQPPQGQPPGHPPPPPPPPPPLPQVAREILSYIQEYSLRSHMMEMRRYRILHAINLFLEQTTHSIHTIIGEIDFFRTHGIEYNIGTAIAGITHPVIRREIPRILTDDFISESVEARARHVLEFVEGNHELSPGIKRGITIMDDNTTRRIEALRAIRAPLVRGENELNLRELYSYVDAGLKELCFVEQGERLRVPNFSNEELDRRIDGIARLRTERLALENPPPFVEQPRVVIDEEADAGPSEDGMAAEAQKDAGPSEDGMAAEAQKDAGPSEDGMAAEAQKYAEELVKFEMSEAVPSEDGMAAEAHKDALNRGLPKVSIQLRQNQQLKYSNIKKALMDKYRHEHNYREMLGVFTTFEKDKQHLPESFNRKTLFLLVEKALHPNQGGTRKRRKQTRKVYSRIKKSRKKITKTRKTR